MGIRAFLNGLLIASLASFTSAGFSQVTGEQGMILPDRVEVGQKAVVIDTTKIKNPSVDLGIRPFRVKNPLFDRRHVGPPNDLPLGSNSGSTTSQVLTQFPGIDATGWTPPDCDVAVGPNHIVQVVNSRVAFFQKNGTKDFEQNSDGFFTGLGAGTFQFDPKVLYDRVNQRFVIIILEQSSSPQTSKVLLAISDDSNPNGVWYKYRLEALQNVSGATYWLDYPGFGYNKDAIVISGNMFGFAGGFNGVQFLVVRTSTILSGGAPTVSYLTDTSSGSVQVAEMISPTATKIFAANDWNTSSFRIYALNNLTGTPTINFTNISVTAFNYPSFDAQSTNSRNLDSLDGRILNVMWRNGKMVMTQNVQANVSGTNRICVRVTEINTNDYPSATPTQAQAVLLSSAGQHINMGAVAVNNTGEMLTVATRSSTSVSADIVTFARLGSDPVNTFGPLTLVESSTGNNYSQVRWGDYFGVDVDPTDDNLFWANAMKIRSDNNWTTSIFSVQVGAPQILLDSVASVPAKMKGGQKVKLVMNLTANATSTVNGTIRVTVPGLVDESLAVTIPSGASSGSVAFTVPRVNRPTPMNLTASALEGLKTASYLIAP